MKDTPQKRAAQREGARRGGRGSGAAASRYARALNRYVAATPLRIVVAQRGLSYAAWVESPPAVFDEVEGSGATSRGAIDSLLLHLGRAIADMLPLFGEEAG